MKYLLFLIPFLLNAQSLLLFDDAVAEDVYAIDLNGSNEYATKTSPTGLDLSAKTFTIMAWVKTPSTILGTANRGIIGTDANPTRGWFFMLGSDEKWTFINSATGVGPYIAAAETREGTWTFVVVQCTTYAAGVSTFKWYLDGVAVNCSRCEDGEDIANGASKLTVGTDGYPQNFYWTSQLGQIQVVSGYALTQTEITNLYNAGGMLNASYGGGTVVAWYKWEGATNEEMLQDHSASDNDLTGTNVTTADQILTGKTYK